MLQAKCKRPVACFVVFLALWTTTPATVQPNPAGVGVSDSLYGVNHPRLLFVPAEIPILRVRVADGGNDDIAYHFIRTVIDDVYMDASMEELLDIDFAQEAVQNLGLGYYLESPPDASAAELGRRLTLYIAGNWNVDDSPYYSSLRLRALALGYDLFFSDGDPGQRAFVRDEILGYIDFMVNSPPYRVWSHRPYLSNKSAMVAASLGLAAICLAGEADPAVVSDALETADEIVAQWLTYHVDSDGACVEGVLYGAWSLRNLIYYFHARLRYDGYNYADYPKIRQIENWFAYELDPNGGGKVNNIHDCTSSDYPLARHTTYFDWAQMMWNSRLSAYLWEHVAGVYGHDMGDYADKAGTVLWHRKHEPINPAELLPRSFLWQDRGLYYWRSGWPTRQASGDVVLSFYSGKFQGGHAQEDQNQFTLSAYGGKFVIDHGPGNAAKQSEAHNIILIDGQGQHNAGSAIGTDGEITEYLSSDFVDYVVGDATAAYTTYSPLNAPNVPFHGTDWSWGYSGANPVIRAIRRIWTVHGEATPPYFVVMDEIEKDGLPHDYEWRLHTLAGNQVDISANPIRIECGSAALDIHVVDPKFEALTRNTSTFDNGGEDPDAEVISLSIRGEKADFVFVMIPGGIGVARPSVETSAMAFGQVSRVRWSDTRTDFVISNPSGGPMTAEIEPFAGGGGRTLDAERHATASSETIRVRSDASMLIIRCRQGQIRDYFCADVSELDVNGREYVRITDGTAHVAMSGDRVSIDRAEADFLIYAPGCKDAYSGQRRLPASRAHGYLVASQPSGSVVAPTPVESGLRVTAHPNPFNPETVLRIDGDEMANVDVQIYDAAGRLVRRLWDGPLVGGMLRWDARDGSGRRVASGLYLLRVQSGDAVTTLKLTVLK